ncbi:MAG: nucleoside triphosphate pyrophosphohydrolase [Firmicutes bacterium]|nr:nucleoside triphosphate pyrophosphohydrolase [Bacillota bacterium]
MDYSLERLVEIVAELRGEHGCPWDKAQTHESIKANLVEEAYEVVDAIDAGDAAELCEELGDVLLHVVFHSQIARENGEFDMSDVLRAIIDKMIRRHPHVFGDENVDGEKEVLRNWERIKQEEKDRPSIFAGIPRALPSLMKAYKIQDKAARVGFDWESVDGAWGKIHEELQELHTAVEDSGDRMRIAEEVGDLLFAVVNVARHLNIDPELALKGATDKFLARFKYIEARAEEIGKPVEEMSLAEMDLLWEESKHPGE